MPRNLLALVLVAAALPLLAGAQTGSSGSPANPPQYRVGDRLEPSKAGKAVQKGATVYREVKWDDLISPSWKPEEIVKSLKLDMMLDSDPRATAALERLREEWDKAPGNAAL